MRQTKEQRNERVRQQRYENTKKRYEQDDIVKYFERLGCKVVKNDKAKR